MAEASLCPKKERLHLLRHLKEIAPNMFISVKTKEFVDGFRIKYLNNLANTLDFHSQMILEARINAFHFMGKSDDGIRKISENNNFFRIGFKENLYDYCYVYGIRGNEVLIYFQKWSYVVREEAAGILDEIESDFPEVMTTTKTLDYLIKNRASLARFGDGEFNLCLGEDIQFQKANSKLQEKLLEILRYESDEKLLVAIPEFNSKTNNIENLIGELSFWEHYWYKRYENLSGFFINRSFGNANISRNSVFLENPLTEIKKLWENRNVVFVIGLKSRFEIKDELFDNCKSQLIVTTAPLNAFNSYDSLLEGCMNLKKDSLFLISCGPTATVLAYDLAMNGYQALDIGHLSNCYDQYLGKIESPEKLPFIRLK